MAYRYKVGIGIMAIGFLVIIEYLVGYAEPYTSGVRYRFAIPTVMCSRVGSCGNRETIDR